MTERLRIEDIHTRYRSTPVHRGVSIEVAPGEAVAVLGPNGAGKTSLLRAVFGAMTVNSGEIWLGDRRLDRCRPHQVAQAGVSISPEGRKVFGPMSVEENLMVGGYAAARGSREPANVEEIFEIFPVLRERRRDASANLSGGQQQMLAIGRALMGRPQLLLLDEPSLGLAPKLVAHVADAIRRIRAELAMSVLIVEQDAGLAFGVSDRAYLLSRGEVVSSGTSAELAASDVVRDLYLGTA